jgi:hypothetical protein
LSSGGVQVDHDVLEQLQQGGEGGGDVGESSGVQDFASTAIFFALEDVEFVQELQRPTFAPGS